ncbi:MAG TPA: hypothetical protein VKG02_05790 [Blastocatellia bacterium]|nr:hypothetical protein [Blastocatellia bacterium]
MKCEGSDIEVLLNGRKTPELALTLPATSGSAGNDQLHDELAFVDF